MVKSVSFNEKTGKYDVIELLEPKYARGNGCWAGMVIGYDREEVVRTGLSLKEANHLAYGESPLEWVCVKRNYKYPLENEFELIWIKVRTNHYGYYPQFVHDAGQLFPFNELKRDYALDQKYSVRCRSKWAKSFVELFEEDDMYEVPEEIRKDLEEIIQFYRKEE